ncbi:hypothetical protein C7B76_24515 [filamentous cyanobacterium CCP2]|nr:hypothetical protein C7B76_24515 [filamentous cyanobacterium CCP2]
MARRRFNQSLFTMFPQQTPSPQQVGLPALKLPFQQNRPKYKKTPCFLATVMMGAMLLSFGGVIQPAHASSEVIPAPRRMLVQHHQRRPAPANRLPWHLVRQVRRDVSQRTGIPPQQLWIARHERHTWTDGCLGLPGQGEFCTQALVPGWQIEVTDGSRSWTYRTDTSGQTLRLEEEYAVEDGHSSEELSNTLRDRILEVAARDSGTSASRLRITESEPRIWDGCLGLDPGRGACTTIAIYGWQVVVSGSRGSWVYHTDGSGNDIRLNETASLERSTLIPQLMTEDELFNPPGQNVVFRSIQQGGIDGSVNEVRLLSDGRVVQLINDRGNFTQIEVNRVSQQQVSEFQQLLEEVQFGSLNWLDYSGGQGADYFTITLTGRGSTTRYADITQDQLPSALQEVIQAWDQIAITG